MRKQIMILCTFCAIAIFSSAQEKYLIKGIANEELNNQQLNLCLMGNGEKAKEVVLDSATVEKGLFSFSRSEERRVGKECSEPCRSRWSPYH